LALAEPNRCGARLRDLLPPRWRPSRSLDGDRVWILPGTPEHETWWRNLRGGADVDLILAGHHHHGHATIIGRSHQPAFAEGLTAYLRANPRARRANGLPSHVPPSPVGTEVGRVSDSTVLVRVELDD
jgi:hypothetical protein